MGVSLYNDNYEGEVLLKQYELYIQGMEKVSDRRQIANGYFMTITTLLFSGIGYVWSSNISVFLNYIIPLLGIGLSYLWFVNLRAYKQLNTQKFSIIHEIEKKLSMNLYSYEREKLGEGTCKKVYYPFSHVEILIPQVVLGIYVMWVIYISIQYLEPLVCL